MTQPEDASASPVVSKSASLRIAWALTRPFFTSRGAGLAWVLVVAVVILNFVEVAFSVFLTDWNQRLFNAAQDLNRARFLHELTVFPFVVAGLIAAYTAEDYCGRILRLRWRAWLTAKCVSLWMKDQSYYRLRFNEAGTDNPDQRISEDVATFVDRTFVLLTNLLSSVIGLTSFIAILWRISGKTPLWLPYLGTVQMPGVMVFAVLAYALLGSLGIHFLGRPLVDLEYAQERREADFRFSLIRLRENAENVALYAGEKVERSILDLRFADILDNWRRLIYRRVALGGTTNLYNNAATLVPWFLLAGRFFSGAIKLGDIIQASSAFDQVRSYLSVLINNYGTFASWQATVNRISGFATALNQIRTPMVSQSQSLSLTDFRAALLGSSPGLPAAHQHIELEDSGGSTLRVQHLATRAPDGRLLGQATSFEIAPGERVLLRGPSGSGKTTLLRAIATLWPYGSGRISSPPLRRLLLAQRPYLPLGTLRDALCYPQVASAVPDAKVREAMTAVGLAPLIPKLDAAAEWSHALSLGEQQRIGFARALLLKPELLVLDESTSALDEAAEAQLYGLVIERLPRAIVLSVGHRQTLERYHHRSVSMGEGAGSTTGSSPSLPPALSPG